jgi:hypothetical protein
MRPALRGLAEYVATNHQNLKAASVPTEMKDEYMKAGSFSFKCHAIRLMIVEFRRHK